MEKSLALVVICLVCVFTPISCLDASQIFSKWMDDLLSPARGCLLELHKCSNDLQKEISQETLQLISSKNYTLLSLVEMWCKKDATGENIYGATECRKSALESDVCGNWYTLVSYINVSVLESSYKQQCLHLPAFKRIIKCLSDPDVYMNNFFTFISAYASYASHKSDIYEWKIQDLFSQDKWIEKVCSIRDDLVSTVVAIDCIDPADGQIFETYSKTLSPFCEEYRANVEKNQPVSSQDDDERAGIDDVTNSDRKEKEEL